MILHQLKPLTITNRQTFFLTPLHCIELLNFLMVKILEIIMDIHHFAKLPAPFGLFHKKVTQTWKRFFFKNKTNNKISGRLSQLWQVRDAKPAFGSSKTYQSSVSCQSWNVKVVLVRLAISNDIT